MMTVMELSKLASISTRTLHYYDSIGLLKPTVVRSNGYRGYGEDAVLRLQQIFFYKELGLTLREIKEILTRPDFDLLQALDQHKQTISRKIVQYQKLHQTITSTINHLTGVKTMTDRSMFSGFTDEQQEKYAEEAEKMYDPKTVRDSNKRWKEYSKDKQQAILQEGKDIYAELAKSLTLDPGGAEIQGLVQRWRDHMAYFWVPSLDQLEGLGHLYNDDERFKKNFDQLHPDLAAAFLSAIKIYIAREKEKGSE